MSLALLVSLLLFFVSLFLLLSSNKGKANSKHSRHPPSPSKLPFIGNLHQLGPLLQCSLRNLSDKHGPIMLLHFGQVPTLVVSSPQMAREVMRTHDLAFANRPSLKAFSILLQGSENLTFAPYGEYWRQVRKLCVVHLFSAKMVKSFQKVRKEELALMIAKIPQSSSTTPIGNSVNLSDMLNSFTCDVICKVVSGKFFREEGKKQLLRVMMEENNSAVGGFHPSDCFPRLAWLDGLFAAKLNAKIKRNAERWDDVLEEVIENHVHQMKEDGAQKESTDFVDVLLSLQKESNGEFQLTKQEMKSLLMDMFVAGTGTSSIVLEWSLAELVRNPKLMKKLQDEVRGLAGRNETVREEDLSKMSYLKAVIKESLRLHPPTPLLIPRESRENCVIGGYEIPKKTRVMFNVWAMGRDPKVWEAAADEFRPERFVDNPIDFIGSDFQFIPFGAGRRICPGINFAVSTTELALANLVHRFDWELPVGMKNGDLNMEEAPGLLTHKKQTLHLIAKPHATM